MGTNDIMAPIPDIQPGDKPPPEDISLPTSIMDADHVAKNPRPSSPIVNFEKEGGGRGGGESGGPHSLEKEEVEGDKVFPTTNDIMAPIPDIQPGDKPAPEDISLPMPMMDAGHVAKNPRPSSPIVNIEKGGGGEGGGRGGGERGGPHSLEKEEVEGDKVFRLDSKVVME